MTRIAFWLSVVVVALSWEVATAQPPPSLGGPPPLNHVFGYSPLVPTVDPFPSKTSGYAPSMFGPNGGKRIYPQQYAHPRLYPPYANPQPAVIRETPAIPEPAVVVGPVVTGSVVWTTQTRGWRRFHR